MRRMPTSHALATSEIRQARSQLSAAVRNAMRSRRRIRNILWYGMGGGTVIGVPFVVMPLVLVLQGRSVGVLPPGTSDYVGGYIAILMPITLSLAGVAVLPTDDRGIKRLCVGEISFLTCIAVGCTLGFIGFILLAIFPIKIGNTCCTPLSSAPGATCVAPSTGACIEYGRVDNDCCGNQGAVSCAANYTFSYAVAIDEGGTWARPHDKGFDPNCVNLDQPVSPYLFHFFWYAICVWTMVYYLAQTLKAAPGTPACCAPGGCFCNRGGHFRMPPRLQLQRCWSVFRYGCFITHVMPLLGFFISGFWGTAPGTAWFSVLFMDIGRFGQFIIYHNASWAFVPLLVTSRVRGWVYRNMVNQGLTEEQRSLMIVAQLVGSEANIDKTMEFAGSRFRCLPFQALQSRHLARTLDNPNELYELAEATQIGSCDAFISQSWHDNGNAKFAALSRWAAKFEAENGRKPLIWLDRAGIDQTTLSSPESIKQNLSCLPVWLAGSQELVMLVGPTYLQRIWCTLEVLVFLRMGKSIDHITLIPLDNDDITDANAGKNVWRAAQPPIEEAQPNTGLLSQATGANHETRITILERKVEELYEANEALSKKIKAGEDLRLALDRFRSFDVSEAKCFNEADRQRLLAVVDAAYGSLDVFSTLVQRVFKQEHAHRFEWSSKSSMHSLDQSEQGASTMKLSIALSDVEVRRQSRGQAPSSLLGPLES